MIAAHNPVARAGVEVEAAPLASPTLGASAALVAMVEEWRSLLDQLNKDGTSDEAVVSLGDRHNALQHAIYDFPAASVADLLAKEPVFRCEMQDAVSGLADGFEPAETLAGAAWLGLFRDFERLTSASPPDHPDGALLALGLPFLAAWRDEGAAWIRCENRDDADCRAAYDAAVLRRNDVTDRIVALPALTPEGLGIKALVLAGYVCTDYGPANPTASPADEHPSGEGAVEWQIQTGAARILAGSDTGGRGVASPLFDPAPMSIAALAALYDAARGAAEHLDALGGGPADPEQVGVRTVLGGEAERLRGVMLACADALAEREPRTLAERRARARVRAMHAVEVGAWADLAGLVIAEGSADAEGGR